MFIYTGVSERSDNGATADAGNLRYSVDIPTSKIRATRFRVSPAASNRPICAHSSSDSFGRRPPILPCARATASPARVRSTISSRSISARAPITWKKKRPIGVDVSMLSVRLRKFTPLPRRSSIRVTRCRILLPNLSSFQTTSVSPSESVRRTFFSPGRSEVFPLILSSNISSHPAHSSAFRCKAVFWSFVDTLT
ncbi:Uncharacterised protein [Enterobacter hormaechei]|nr:hypothetical protein AZ021_000227 [Enterobacter ludwigii]CAA2944218.1 Uncharacterised protein [Enterobacter cloacae]VAC83710.1 Uncharacterised protein [Enterobacter hormaechei]BBV88594.1 hypothetical protein STW0522ENT62_40400 [Enterobacter kobei]CAA2946571.1 Uncharacterised protein [Enterobacter cloacae]